MRLALLSVVLLWACVTYTEAVAATTTASNKADCKSQMGLYFCDACTNSPLMCHECNPGYTPKGDGSGCLKCSANCATCTYDPAKPTTDTLCDVCNSAYYLQTDKTCAACDDTNCALCYKNNATATSTGTVCYQCKPAHYTKASTNKCTGCDSTCSVCTETECQTCLVSSQAVKTGDKTKCGACVSACSQCDPGPDASTPVECKACSINYYLDTGNCIDCESSKKCKECKNGNKCDICKTKYYLASASATTCSDCTSNCDTCTDATTCSACSTGFINKSPNDISCSICNTDCKTCALSEAVSGGKCASCMDSTYALDATTKQCMKCSTAYPNCDQCTSSGGTVACTSCDPNYIRDGNNCHACPADCPTGNCNYNSTHTRGTYCTTACNTGFGIDADDQCTDCVRCTTCSYNSTASAMMCECPTSGDTPDTMTSSNTNQYMGYCRASEYVCKKGNYYDETGGQSGQPGCTACDDANCYHCNYTGVCIACDTSTNYALAPDSSGTCKACTIAGSTCTSCTWTDSTSTMTCGGCADNYYLDTTCKPCISGCKTCSVSSPTTCTACITSTHGKSTSDSKCYPCDSTCPAGCTATGADAAAVTVCTSCPSGTIQDASDTSKCKTCPSHCSACAFQSGSTTVLECSGCDTYYGVLNKACSSCPANCTACAIDASKVADTLYCTTCQANYVQNAAACTRCPFNCDTCTTTGGSVTCTKCKSPYYVDSQGTCSRCITDCLDCADGTTCKSNMCAAGKGLTLDTKSCTACSDSKMTGVSNCNNCTDYTATKKAMCMGCSSGYAIADDHSSCNSTTTFSADCKLASDTPPSCTTCEAGRNTVKVGDKCLLPCKACGAGTYLNPTSTVATCNQQTSVTYTDTQCEFGCTVQLIQVNGVDTFGNRGCVMNHTCEYNDQCPGNSGKCLRCCDTKDCNDGYYTAPNKAGNIQATSVSLILAAIIGLYFAK